MDSGSQDVATLSEGQKAALLTLLTDEDAGVYRTVRNRILAQGRSSATWLQAHVLSSDPLLRRRVNEIFNHLDRQDADTNFLGFCISRGKDLDIEEACWLLARTRYPEINPVGYSALLDNHAGELLDRVDFGADARSMLEAINEYLFKELKLRGNAEDFYAPDNSYLNRVLDRRCGNPISLSMLYVLICRRLRLPVTGIGMPGHFLCRFQTSKEELYIDAFHTGRLLTRVDCIRHLVRTGHEYSDRLLAPISPRRVLLRMCTNLHQIYVQKESPEEAARFRRYIVALSK